MVRLNESVVEEAALDWLREIGYRTGFGPLDAAVGEVREKPSDAVLWNRVEESLRRLNPQASAQMVSDALKRAQRAESQDAVLENQRMHDLMVKGVPVETKASDGQT
ncbi:MAG: type I restriction endonuclease, partial [Actinomycetaceae bacterium]|nr:type I restriction endonuclease [Actinomycetaceae bacterium]